MSLFKYLLFSILFVSCIGTKNVQELNIEQSWVFTIQEFVGNIQVDENGKPLNKGYWLKHFIVMEIKGDVLPKWESLMINDKENIINYSSIHDTVIYIGKDKNTFKNIFVSTKKNGKLLLLKVEDYFTELPFKNPMFTLNGKLGEKKVSILLKNDPVLIENQVRP